MNQIYAKGDVVVLPFPFSDLSDSKNRPCLVVAKLLGIDIIICEITTQPRKDIDAISLKQKDFQKGNLNIDSWIRPNKLLTLETSMVKYRIGKVKQTKIKEVEKKLCKIFIR